MKEKFELKAENRTLEGKKVKQLRNKGLLPAVVYSKKTSVGGKGSMNIQVDYKEFNHVYAGARETHLVDVKLGSTVIKALISEVQKDPMSLMPTHVCFHQVDLTEKIEASVPVVLIGAEENDAIKGGELVLVHILKEISVECLPTDIPDHFEVDLAPLKEANDVLTVEECIKADANVTILDDKDDVVVKLDFQAEEEVEEEPKSVDDVEVIEKGKQEDEEEGSEDKKEEKSDK